MSDQKDKESVSDIGGFVKEERLNKPFSPKRVLPTSLFGRSLLILILPILLIQIVTAYMFFERHWQKVTSRLAFAVAGEVSAAVNVLEAVDDPELAGQLLKGIEGPLDIKIAYKPDQAFDEQSHQTRGIVWEPAVAQTLKSELSSQLNRPFVVRMNFQEKWIEVDVAMPRGLMQVHLPQGRLFSSSGYVFLLWVLGSSILLVSISVIFMRNQIRPIRKLAVAANMLGKGRDVPNFKPEGAREVRQAAQAFMDMHRRIKRQVSQRTAMLAGVSHDLRTPLTRLKLQLAMMDTQDARDMQDDLREMEAMIDGYLDFVRGEGGEQTRITDLNALFEKLKLDGERSGFHINMDMQDKMNAMIRPMGFERCLSNVIMNAGKYAQNVWFSAQITDDKKLIVIVEDDGPGIPEAEYEEVFKPFYRLEQSRNKDTGGVGLGLPIAMDIVHAHGGKIWLETSEHGGLKVVIRMPV